MAFHKRHMNRRTVILLKMVWEGGEGSEAFVIQIALRIAMVHIVWLCLDKLLLISEVSGPLYRSLTHHNTKMRVHALCRKTK